MQSNKNFSGMQVYLRAIARNGQVFEEYHADGIDGPLHNDDGPAFINTRRDGLVIEEKYYRDGKLHRDCGPAVIERSSMDGSANREEYYRDGQLHRDDGPASLLRDSHGTEYAQKYWREGRIVEPKNEIAK